MRCATAEILLLYRGGHSSLTSEDSMLCSGGNGLAAFGMRVEGTAIGYNLLELRDLEKQVGGTSYGRLDEVATW